MSISTLGQSAAITVCALGTFSGMASAEARRFATRGVAAQGLSGALELLPNESSQVVSAVEVEDESGALFYEVEYLDALGHDHTLMIDAQSRALQAW